MVHKTKKEWEEEISWNERKHELSNDYQTELFLQTDKIIPRWMMEN
jgi:hypothetical protein